jgi:hypothetical protein
MELWQCNSSSFQGRKSRQGRGIWHCGGVSWELGRFQPGARGRGLCTLAVSSDLEPGNANIKARATEPQKGYRNFIIVVF